MWLLIPVVLLLLLSFVGRQVRLGRLKNGPWFRNFRPVRSILSLLLLAAGAMMLVRELWVPGIGCVLLSLFLGGTVRVSGMSSRRQEPLTAASYSAEEVRAYQVLGLPIGADRKAIKEAWAKQMKVAHPDQGGDVRRASELNAARDVLLRRR